MPDYNGTTLIQLKRFSDTNNVSGSTLEIGEPAFDYVAQRLYIGTEPSGIALGDLFRDGKYFRPVNSKYPIRTEDIAQSAITTNTIKDLNVTTDKLADSSVTTPKIANSAVTNDKIADGVIAYNKLNLSDGDIPLSKVSIGAGSIDASKIGGKIKWDNLPAFEFTNNTIPTPTGNVNATIASVRAYQDNNGLIINANYGAKLELTSDRLSLVTPNGNRATDINISDLVKTIKPKLNLSQSDISGIKINWNDIDGKPPSVNLTSSIGNSTTPIYYDASSKSFKTCNISSGSSGGGGSTTITYATFKTGNSVSLESAVDGVIAYRLEVNTPSGKGYVAGSFEYKKGMVAQVSGDFNGKVGIISGAWCVMVSFGRLGIGTYGGLPAPTILSASWTNIYETTKTIGK